jgi:hypothetical protein
VWATRSVPNAGRTCDASAADEECMAPGIQTQSRNEFQFPGEQKLNGASRARRRIVICTHETHVYADDRTCLMGSKDVSGRALLHEVGATFVGQDLLHEVDTVSGQILLRDVDTVSGRAFLTRSTSFRARTCFMRLHIMLGV